MNLSDPVSDFLTRLRNGQMRHKRLVSCPWSRLKEHIADTLKAEGYIQDYDVVKVRTGIQELQVVLKYRAKTGVIQEIGRVSRPGRRVYVRFDKMPRFYGGLGVFVLSTSRGVMSDAQARRERLGGEVLCRIF